MNVKKPSEPEIDPASEAASQRQPLGIHFSLDWLFVITLTLHHTDISIHLSIDVG